MPAWVEICFLAHYCRASIVTLQPSWSNYSVKWWTWPWVYHPESLLLSPIHSYWNKASDKMGEAISSLSLPFISSTSCTRCISSLPNLEPQPAICTFCLQGQWEGSYKPEYSTLILQCLPTGQPSKSGDMPDSSETGYWKHANPPKFERMLLLWIQNGQHCREKSASFSSIGVNGLPLNLVGPLQNGFVLKFETESCTCCIINSTLLVCYECCNRLP